MSGHSTSCHVSPRPLEPHFALPNRPFGPGSLRFTCSSLRSFASRVSAASSGGRTESCSPTLHLQVSRSCEDLLFFMIVGAASTNLQVPALLRCDFALRSEAAGCSCARLPAGLRLGAGPFASRHSQGPFFILRQ